MMEIIVCSLVAAVVLLVLAHFQLRYQMETEHALSREAHNLRREDARSARAVAELAREEVKDLKEALREEASERKEQDAKFGNGLRDVRAYMFKRRDRRR